MYIHNYKKNGNTIICIYIPSSAVAAWPHSMFPVAFFPVASCPEQVPLALL